MNVKEIVIWKHFLIWKITTTKYIFNPNNQEPNTPWSIHFCRVLDNDIAEPDHIYIYICVYQGKTQDLSETSGFQCLTSR